MVSIYLIPLLTNLFICDPAFAEVQSTLNGERLDAGNMKTHIPSLKTGCENKDQFHFHFEPCMRYHKFGWHFMPLTTLGDKLWGH